MKEATEKTKHFVSGVVIGAICSFVIVFSTFLCVEKYREYNRGSKHVRAMINKNCNDCHIGKSFVSLFKHESIRHEIAKDNSPTLDAIMVNAKLKVY